MIVKYLFFIKIMQKAPAIFRGCPKTLLNDEIMLFAGGGASAIVTTLGILRSDPETREFRLTAC